MTLSHHGQLDRQNPPKERVSDQGCRHSIVLANLFLRMVSCQNVSRSRSVKRELPLGAFFRSLRRRSAQARLYGSLFPRARRGIVFCRRQTAILPVDLPTGLCRKPQSEVPAVVDNAAQVPSFYRGPSVIPRTSTPVPSPVLEVGHFKRAPSSNRLR